MLRDSPGASVPSAHGKVVTHAPLVERNVKPAGVGSSTVTPGALEGPPLTMVKVYAIEPPGTTVAGPVFVIERSAVAATVVVAVAELFP